MFAGIGVREPLPNASEAFTMFGEAHREIERHAIRMLKTVKPVRSSPSVDNKVIKPITVKFNLGFQGVAIADEEPV